MKMRYIGFNLDDILHEDQWREMTMPWSWPWVTSKQCRKSENQCSKPSRVYVSPFSSFSCFYFLLCRLYLFPNLYYSDYIIQQNYMHAFTYITASHLFHFY